MKNKLIIALSLLVFGINYAQEESKNRVNEVKVNFLNTIAIASVEVGYERFFGGDQSLELNVFINDRFSYYTENTKDGKEFKTNSLGLAYNFYFSDKKNGTGYYLSPFFKYRFGDYTRKEELRDSFNNPYIGSVTTDISSPILGLGLGYKWVWNQKLAVGTLFSLGRNFSKPVNELFTAVETNCAITIGYRF